MAVSQKTRGTQRRIVVTVRTERAQTPHKPKAGLWRPREITTRRRRREMIALKMLLMIAGVLLMAVAAGNSAAWAVDADSVCDEEESRRGWVASGVGCSGTGTWSDCLAGTGGAGAGGMHAAADGDEHGGGAEWDGRRAHQPDRRNGAGNAVSGIALCYSAGGERADV